MEVQYMIHLYQFEKEIHTKPHLTDPIFNLNVFFLSIFVRFFNFPVRVLL